MKNCIVFNQEMASEALPRCAEDVHKYQRGAVAVLGGCSQYGGAPLLCGCAALYAGAGIVTVCQPEKSLRMVSHALPMALIHKTTPHDFLCREDAHGMGELLKRFRTVAIGPGIGREEETWNFIIAILGMASWEYVVLDADALVLLAGHLEQFVNEVAPERRRSILLTPHEGEFNRLYEGNGGKESERSCQTMDLAKQLGCVVLRKGAETLVASPEGQQFLVKNGVPALATAGSGDVLTGVIAALMAAGCAPVTASALGAWCHGQAGINFAGKNCRFGFIADDLPKEISRVLSNL